MVRRFSSPFRPSRNTKGQHDMLKVCVLSKKESGRRLGDQPDWKEAMVRMAVMQLGIEYGTWQPPN